MKTFTVLLVLPVLIYANIDVDITASDDKSQRQVHLSGSNVDVITDQERETFQLSDETIKAAINAHVGSTPDDVFLKSPTPWGDLYITNGWKQVSRILKPLKATIQSVVYEPSLVLTQVFNNTSSKQASFQAEVRQDVENTVSSTWERHGEISAHKDIKYGLDIKAMAVSGNAVFSYNSKWGENVMKSQTVTVGSKTGVNISLEPNQSVIAELYATKGSMKVQIDYEATLSGSVAANYANLYKGHHFWSYDINKVLSAAGLKRSVLSSELIDIGFYSDSKVIIRDADTNDLLLSVPLTVF